MLKSLGNSEQDKQNSEVMYYTEMRVENGNTRNQEAILEKDPSGKVD
jgi:hypothetical protein